MASGHRPYVRYRSSRPGKKWDVYVPTARGQRKVSFGQAGASDFTMHKDKARRERYRARHAHDKIADPYSPGFWSFYALWGASSDSKAAFRSAVSRAKRELSRAGKS